MKLRKIKLRKKAAFEMSITTIVILVIAMTMLILGIILVRKMMCGAISLTGDISDKTRSQIDDLFQSQGGEAQCVGSGTQAVDLVPGKTNYIWCGIRSPGGTPAPAYDISIVSATPQLSTLGLIGTAGWSGQVSGSDQEPKKIIRLNIPKDAAEGPVIIKITVKRAGQVISTQDLDFNIRRLDWFRGTIC